MRYVLTTLDASGNGFLQAIFRLRYRFAQRTSVGRRFREIWERDQIEPGLVLFDPGRVLEMPFHPLTYPRSRRLKPRSASILARRPGPHSFRRSFTTVRRSP